MPETLVQIEQKPPQRRLARPASSSSARARSATAPRPKNLSYLGLPNPREWQPIDARLEAAAGLEAASSSTA